MDDTLWNHVTGAKSKRPDLQTDAPSQQPMRAGIKPADRKQPTADQKRVRRQMAKSASGEAETVYCPECDGVLSGTYNEVRCRRCGEKYTPTDSSSISPGLGRVFRIGPGGVLKAVSETTASTTTKESTMSETHTEADLLAKMAGATTLQEQSYWGEMLTDFRNGRRDQIAASAGLDFGAMEAADLTPTYGLEPLTAASMGSSAGGLDWLADIQPDTHDDQKISSTMQAEATLWYESVWEPVKADPEEFAAQTRNAARRAAAQFGLQSEAAASVFTAKVAHLHGKTAFDEVQPGPYEMPNGSHHTPPTDKSTFDGIVNGEQGSTDDPKSNSLDSPSLKEGDQPEGDKAQGVDSQISDTDGAKYVKDNAQGTTYTDPMPSGGKGASRKTAGVDVSKVKIKDRADNTFTGTTSDGKEVTFRLSESDAKQVRSVMFGDLGMNFSGLTIEQSDIISGEKTSSLDFFSALRQSLADEDPKSTSHDAPSLAQGEQPEGDHPHSVMDQTPAAQDQSTWGGDPDPLNTGGTEGGGNASPGAPYATASLQSIGTKVATEAQTSNTVTFGRALSALSSLDDKVGEFTGRQIVEMVLASRDVSEETRRVLAAKVAESEGGNTCAVCGDKIAKDPASENPSTWHHDNGETHDHEAKPSGESKTSAAETSTCKHCGRHIEKDSDGRWVDPEATGDDSIWRETCDDHDTFTAEHEPKTSAKTAGEYAGGSPKAGDTATCHADGQKIEFFDGAWYHLKGGPSHNDVYPANKTERESKEGSRDPFVREAGEGQRIPYKCPSCGHTWVKKALYGGETCPKCKTKGEVNFSKKAAACGCPNAEEGEHLGDCPLRSNRAEFEDSGDAEDRWYNDKFSSKTATFYCTTHEVYVGDGNRDTHTRDSCNVEQRKSKEAGGESVEVSVIPECDICKYDLGKGGVPAAYDGATVMGPWANMCEEHFQTHGVGLGTGRGQRLVLRSQGSKTAAGWAILTPDGKPLWGKVHDTKEEAQAHFDSVKDRKDHLVPKNISTYQVGKVGAKHSDGSGEWKVQVAGTGENVWSQNSITFDSPEEAEAAAKDLASRWFGMDMARVVPTSTPNREPVDPADPTIVLNYR